MSQMSKAAAPAVQPSVPAAAVSAIAVTALAAMGASISSQMVVLLSADLSGAFHVSADEGSWIGTVSAMAEVAAVPIAATLVQAAGLKRVILLSAAVFAVCAIASPGAPNLNTLLPIRFAQSFAGGILQVVMMLSVMGMLSPGRTRDIGLAAFAFASSAPAATAAGFAAFFTERLGWQGLYIFDLIYCGALISLVLFFMKSSPSRLSFAEIDWMGYAVLSVGLAALILMLNQGDRYFWWENNTIVGAAIVAAIFIPAAIVLFAFEQKPLIQIALLTKASFGWAIAISTFYRFGLVMTAFVVPQALARLQSFRTPEIAAALIWMFAAQVVAFPVAWWWATRYEARTPLAVGMLLFAVGAFLSTFLTSEWHETDFILTLVLIGTGQGLFLVPTLFYATRDVSAAEGTTAATFFNLSRVVGQAFGIAVIGSLITFREKFHSADFVDAITGANTAVVDRLQADTQTFLRIHSDAALANTQALKSISGDVSSQAYVLAFADAFLIVSLVLAVSAFLVLMLPSLRPAATTLSPSKR